MFAGVPLIAAIIFAMKPEMSAVELKPRIVGGRIAEITQFPYQVSILKAISPLKPYKPICSGSLIHPEYVVTAAHCVCILRFHKLIPVKTKSLLLIAGSNDTFGVNIPGQIRTANSIHINRKFDIKNIDNDIAIIHVYTPFLLNKYASTIKIRETPAKVGDMCVASGWGATKQNKPGSRALLQVKIPIADRKQCEKNYLDANLYPITGNKFCAGFFEGGKDACQGDSGGPFVCDGQLTGIISYGYGCARNGFPGIYVNISNYVDWIQNIILRNSSSNLKSSNSTPSFSRMIMALSLILIWFN